MAKQAITNFFKREAYKRWVDIKKDAWISDLKHDFENQIVKINQALENFLAKHPSPAQKSLLQRYQDLCRDFPGDTAKVMIFIDRIVNQMSSEMVCFSVLDGWVNLDAYKQKNRIVVHKIIFRLLFLYADDFAKSGIRCELESSEHVWEINESIFSAIILKIIQNCTKYCQPDSELRITIKQTEVIFSMQSLKILSQEKERIFEDGYSGKMAVRAWKWKTWKWLFHAKKLADFHSLKLYVKLGVGHAVVGKLLYSQNEFVIKN